MFPRLAGQEIQGKGVAAESSAGAPHPAVTLPVTQVVDARSKGRMLRGVLLAASVLMVISNTPLAPALPQLRDAFVEASDLQIRMIITIPALVIVLVQPLVGWIADRHGRKPLLVLSTLLYGVVGSSGFFVQDIGALLAGRALFGVAVAGLMTSVSALIADYYSGRGRAHFIGLQAAAMGLGNSFFLLLGGVLAEGGWRPPFLMFLAALALLPFAVHSLYEPSGVRSGRGRGGQPAGAARAWPLLRPRPLHLHSDLPQPDRILSGAAAATLLAAGTFRNLHHGKRLPPSASSLSFTRWPRWYTGGLAHAQYTFRWPAWHWRCLAVPTCSSHWRRQATSSTPGWC